MMRELNLLLMSLEYLSIPGKNSMDLLGEIQDTMTIDTIRRIDIIGTLIDLHLLKICRDENPVGTS